MFQAGDIIDDVWVVEHILGAGGMGAVVKCHNLHAPRIKAAIKVLGQNLVNLPEAQKRFVREAELLFALRHPHIVKVRNVRLEALPPYIEMEFVEGVSLDLVIERGALSVEVAVLFAEQIASALRYLHRNQVCHRDLKPANVLVRKGATLKLVDFGLATEGNGDRITAAGTAFGTVSYAPPEWVRPHELDPHQWDLYALGVVLFEMLTGTIAFEVAAGAGMRQAALQIMSEKQQVPCLDPGPSFAEPLRQLVRDLTAKLPADRPQRAKEVVRRLESLEQELGIDANAVLADALDPDEFREQVVARALQAGADTPAPTDRASDLIDVQPPRRPSVLESPEPNQLAELRDEITGLRDELAKPNPARPMPALIGMAALGGGGGLVVLGGMMLVVALFGAWWWATRAPPTATRAVHVRVVGLEGQHVAVRIGELAPTGVDGDQHVFPPHAPGPVSLSWAIGEGCDGAGCPGPACADWCVTGSRTLVVEAGGDGPAQLDLALEPPPAREVQVRVAGAGTRAAEVRAGDQVAPITDGVASLGLPPGRYELHVLTDGCGTSDVGCSDAGTCPEDCASVTSTVDVPRVGPVRASLALPEAPVPEPPPAPAVTPRPARQGAGTLVTQAQYAGWLSSHPEWSRDAAIAGNRADSNYLQHLDIQSPGASPVVEVSWSAGAAYCAPRGGLAALGAAPTTWSETDGPIHEWRTDGDRPAWRRYDGETSHQLSRAHTNAFTGFRCAR